MAELPPLWVEYPAADPAAGAVVVERVTSEAVDEELAKGVITVIRDAYTAQFGNRFVPSSAIAGAIDPGNPDIVAERTRVMRSRMEAGQAQYWIARDDEGQIAGLSKVMANDRYVYLGDVMVAPPWKNGLGSRLLHAPFKYGGYDERKRVELDAFEGSSVNAWYVKLGFRPDAEFFGIFEVGGYSMLTRRIAVPATIGLGGLVRNLEKHKPELAEATLHATQPEVR